MGSAKPILGYASRTDAVIALRTEGLSTRQIAARIGIGSDVVCALEASASRRAGRAVGAGRSPKLTPSHHAVTVDPEVMIALRPHAARRALSVDALARKLLALLVDDSLVDALLDDADEVEAGR